VPSARTAPIKLAEETLLLARSVEGRPIRLYVLGNGDLHVLILAGFHGNEPTGAQLADSLLTYLRQNPAACEGRRVAIAPAVNPDGLLRHERTNANGVDLNRNFPASNWSRARTGRDSRGRVPGSEPETQAAMVAVHLTEPARILSIHSIDRGRQCNNYDGPAAALAQAMSARNGYPARPQMGYDTPGSFGTWAGVDRRIPTITLELPRDASGDQCWAANRDALLAFIAGG
jgi:protein MpaA